MTGAPRILAATEPQWLEDMFDQFVRLRRQHNVILAWQMGDWFEFYFSDAEHVASVLGIALTARGKRANGQPIPMCAVPADARFTRLQDCLLIPLTPTDHFFGKIVAAGSSLAVALHVDGRGDGTHLREIVAVFHSGDSPKAATGDVITLVGPMPRLWPVAVQ
jgi:DNA mismatch repair protein MutS